MGDHIIWTLAPDRTKRRAVGRPDFFYDIVPPVGATYDRINDMWLSATALAGTTTYDRINDMWLAAAPLPVQPPTFVRPTGPGIYAIEDLTLSGDWATMPGAGGITAAMNNVATLAAAPNGTRTLTLPEHTFTAPSFAQSQNYLGFLVPQQIGIVGSGPNTIFEVAKDGMTQAQSDSWERYNQPIGSINLLYIFLTLNSPPSTVFSQFHIRGQRQRVGGIGRDHYFGGWNIQGSTQGLTINDVKVSGAAGYLNSPPGETFLINVNNGSNVTMNRVECDGRLEETGVKVGACGIGTNKAQGIVLRDCYTHHMYASHGLAYWSSRDVTTYNHRSEYNGTSGPSTGGISGDGINHELTWNSQHYSPRIGFNSLSTLRYTGDPGTGGWYGNTFPHRMDDLVITDGQPFRIRIEGVQTTSNLTFNRCPTPVYF